MKKMSKLTLGTLALGTLSMGLNSLAEAKPCSNEKLTEYQAESIENLIEKAAQSKEYPLQTLEKDLIKKCPDLNWKAILEVGKEIAALEKAIAIGTTNQDYKLHVYKNVFVDTAKIALNECKNIDLFQACLKEKMCQQLETSQSSYFLSCPQPEIYFY